MNLKRAKKIMGKNFIGPDELGRIADILRLPGNLIGRRVPAIPFDEKTLKRI